MQSVKLPPIMVDNKINLDIDHYEPSDSEDEYTPREKKLLEKVSRQRQNESSDEEEVLGLDGDDDSDEESSEDDGDIDQFRDSDESDEDEGLPDVRAWGKKKHAYYDTNFVDQDYATYSAKEEEQAALEAQEAKSIQQRLAKQLNESDFSLDVLTAPGTEQDQDDDAAKLTTDFSKMTVREKQMLFKKDSPEFEGLVDDMHHHLEESQAVLLPFLDYCKQNNVVGLPIIKFAKTLNNLYMNYGNNVAYYLILKAKRIPVKSHPVVKRLVQMRQLIEQLVQRYEKIVKPEIERLMADLQAGKEIQIVPLQQPPQVQPKKLRNLMRSFSGEDDEDKQDQSEDDDFLNVQPKMKRIKLDSSQAMDDDDEAQNGESDAEAELDQNDDEVGDGNEDDGTLDQERRPINYQISKNKGLTPHKHRSDQRNPRVRNRKRYMKAVKRRKGAVRTPRTEIPKYDGEKTGIKAYLKRSINIK